MYTEHRSGDGSAQKIRNSGNSLSKASQEYQYGRLDCQAGRPMVSMPSAGYKAGYNSAKKHTAEFNNRMRISKVLKEQGLSVDMFVSMMDQGLISLEDILCKE